MVTRSPLKQKARVQVGCKSASYQAVICTASAGDTHFLARRTNLPTASIVPLHRVA